MGVMTKGLEVVKIRLVKEEPLMNDRYVTCPEDAVQVLSDELAEIDREVFAVLNFNTDGSVINMNIVSVGTLNSSMAYPREVFKSSILSNAASVILVHNHPSGHTKPSKADYDITKRLIEAGEILGIDVLDHIIISGQNKQRNYSLRDHDELGKSYKEIKEKEYCR